MKIRVTYKRPQGPRFPRRNDLAPPYTLEQGIVSMSNPDKDLISTYAVSAADLPCLMDKPREVNTMQPTKPESPSARPGTNYVWDMSKLRATRIQYVSLQPNKAFLVNHNTVITPPVGIERINRQPVATIMEANVRHVSSVEVAQHVHVETPMPMPYSTCTVTHRDLESILPKSSLTYKEREDDVFASLRTDDTVVVRLKRVSVVYGSTCRSQLDKYAIMQLLCIADQLMSILLDTGRILIYIDGTGLDPFPPGIDAQGPANVLPGYTTNTFIVTSAEAVQESLLDKDPVTQLITLGILKKKADYFDAHVDQAYACTTCVMPYLRHVLCPNWPEYYHRTVDLIECPSNPETAYGGLLDNFLAFLSDVHGNSTLWEVVIRAFSRHSPGSTVHEMLSLLLEEASVVLHAPREDVYSDYLRSVVLLWHIKNKPAVFKVAKQLLRIAAKTRNLPLRTDRLDWYAATTDTITADIAPFCFVTVCFDNFKDMENCVRDLQSPSSNDQQRTLSFEMFAMHDGLSSMLPVVQGQNNNESRYMLVYAFV